MSVIGLNLPTDVPWEQFCVTDDMMAERCLRAAPSPEVAVHRSREIRSGRGIQVYPGRKITYLKVACTITGYQPRDKEIEGTVNFRGANGTTVQKVDSLLDSYHPCTGALIQVAVSPASGNVMSADYPYFMDLQPEKRELYEMVTETGERSSRSIEHLNVGKASGTSQSMEVLVSKMLAKGPRRLLSWPVL